MNLKLDIAQGIGAASTWGLKHVFHRPAANFPGKVGLYVDPKLIGDLSSRVREGSTVVVGTNGKTTVTNLLADAFGQAGKSVVCNRTGANLDSGVATALLQVKSADWGVFESDELWFAKIAPLLQPRFVVLLNLFRDQLDRMGEIEHIQESIAGALTACPETALVYNCDDPLCQAIADRVVNERIPFGIGEDMGLAQSTVADASMCQRCESALRYNWRQYGQLGAYFCETCGFTRAQPAFTADQVRFGQANTSFRISVKTRKLPVSIPFTGAYMVYNALAVYTAASLCGVHADAVSRAISAFDPRNGRLQLYEIDGRRILLNLAKNPTGFNQNIDIVLRDGGPRAAAFFINDREADGHDVSWLWDVDFQKLSDVGGLVAFAGGIRSHDMQVRLKYAGVDAQLVDGAEDFLAKACATLPDATCYLVANYTALPKVKAELDKLQAQAGSASSDELRIGAPADEAGGQVRTPSEPRQFDCQQLRIVHLYPELLNLYGDGGNVIVLEQRARWRGLNVEVVRLGYGQSFDLSDADIVFLGGGPDREQHMASRGLLEQADNLRAYVEDGGVLLAICGGYQILGRTWLLGDEAVPGLGIVDVETRRAEGGSHNRLVDNIVLESPLAAMPVVGYENHAGRTFLGPGCKPFGRVIGHHGHGNNDTDKADGVLYRNVVGTYLHGPLLAKNPEVADWLIQRALDRRAARLGAVAPTLSPLDDTAERVANAFMCCKLNVPR